VCWLDGLSIAVSVLRAQCHPARRWQRRAVPRRGRRGRRGGETDQELVCRRPVAGASCRKRVSTAKIDARRGLEVTYGTFDPEGDPASSLKSSSTTAPASGSARLAARSHAASCRGGGFALFVRFLAFTSRRSQRLAEVASWRRRPSISPELRNERLSGWRAGDERERDRD
jgi:hypothetical protein